MCTVSMIGDFYGEKWNTPEYQKIITNFTEVSRVEFERVKKEVEDMKALLKRAKIYDEKNNEPNCEMDEKMRLLKIFAQAVGIDLDEILKK